MPLSSDVKKQLKARQEPRCLWAGPCGEGPNGGITQSMLSRYLCCKERFRIAVIEGLRTAEGFNHRMHYGNMWHVCEEALAKGPTLINGWCSSIANDLIAYCKGLVAEYPTSGDQINHWYNICKTQFPVYVDWWMKSNDMKKRVPVAEELVFDTPFDLPSGRVVRLRGKFDSIDSISKRFVLQENKTKGEIDQQQLAEQLGFDLQTMLYLVALDIMIKEKKFDKSLGTTIEGVRYNVIRRPLAGGKGSIKRKEPTKSNPNGESAEEFYARLGTLIKEANGDTEEGRESYKLKPGEHYFFMRWNVEITKHDIERFKREFLTPCLEEVCDWYECVPTHLNNPYDCGVKGDQDYIDTQNKAYHYRFPYGVMNWTLEGGKSDVDEYLLNGSEVGLTRVDSLFGELQ